VTGEVCERCEGQGWAPETDGDGTVRFARCPSGVEPVRAGPAPQPPTEWGLDGELTIPEFCVLCHRNRAMPLALVCPPCWDNYWRRVLRSDPPPGPPEGWSR
jgi:hypothetical protein